MAVRGLVKYRLNAEMLRHSRSSAGREFQMEEAAILMKARRARLV